MVGKIGQKERQVILAKMGDYTANDRAVWNCVFHPKIELQHGNKRSIKGLFVRVKFRGL